MILSDGNLQLGENGLIYYKDIIELINYYSDFFDITPPSTTQPANSQILISIFNGLVECINSGSVYYDEVVYDKLVYYMSTFKSGSLMENIIFPKLTWVPVYKTFEITTDTTFNVPKIATYIVVNKLIAAGGGGAWGSGEMYGWDNHNGLWLYWGGSGGSGGSYQNVQFDVKYNDSISITIGTGGIGSNIQDTSMPNNELRHATSGGDSIITKNNSDVYHATGGGGGVDTTPGSAGTPGGNSGIGGGNGRKHKENNGNWGAASIWPGSAGRYGGDSSRSTYGNPPGQPGNHGGGGGSGGYSYRGGGICEGGNGGDGYCSISLYCPKNWTI
ncbi:MAG: bacillopeptidase F [Caudoviricetes sp.]|nr:MAG: bacillopeptidase F [Caudoviricetes sp.]